MSQHDSERTNAHGLPGTVREVRKAADGQLLGWAAHLPAGWAFIPALRRACAMTPNLHATFISCLPVWTGGLQAIASKEIKP